MVVRTLECASDGEGVTERELVLSGFTCIDRIDDERNFDSETQFRVELLLAPPEHLRPWRLCKASVQFGAAALFHRPAVRGAVVIACIAASSKNSQSLDEDITMSWVRSFSIE